MGLNNQVCLKPEYWCRLHQVWLSEEDVKNKKCFAKPTFDLLGVKKCTCIDENKNRIK